ncbi:uncharacterized protein PRCAT00000078001 [Priceomyces carsonii]|uniref:uncharacterized protein n=1 Tax=Priceomyces carsonii TaxID=28549 RepID=UPI002ED8E4AB|nr:unnamed protein product [Priceomyces carsonii]
MSDLVPHYETITAAPVPVDEARYERLVKEFISNFKEEPTFFSRSPGRVNLMGDHIDYCYFSVLPMAIEADVVVAVGVNDSLEINLTNTDPKFSTETIILATDGKIISIDKERFSWASYFRCAMIVAHNFILENYPEIISGGTKPLKGMNMTFDGTVPTGGGLSSSAAFCVASTLAVLRANGIEKISKKDLTRITVVSEHYVGVNTGGMDQCASIYGEKSKALLIQFKPELKGIPFEFPHIEPNEIVFLISNSLLQANKHETAPTNYNLRVVEVAVAAEVLAKKYNLKLAQDSNLGTGTLRGFMDTYFTRHLHEEPWDGVNINVGINRLTRLLDLIENDYSEMEKNGFTTEEAAARLEMSQEEFELKFLSKFPVKYTVLKLYLRSKHVFSDALRVLQTLKIIRNFNGDTQGFLNSFGSLMDESQISCNINNNSSTPELEKLCKIARNNGAIGSRITGAGFGGSLVHLTTTDKLAKLKSSLITEYYQNQIPGITQKELDEAIVVSRPAAGTCTIASNDFL